MVGRLSSGGSLAKGSSASGSESEIETVHLIDTPAGQIAAYVRTLGRLPDDVDWVLVGGLAANVRIARVHRATNDVDTVTTDVDRLIEVLVDFDDAERLSSAKVQLHNPEVEVDVMHSTEGRELPPEERDRAFALARRFALRSASPVAITVLDEHRNIVERLTIRVGSRAALVALKTLSFPERKDGAYKHKVGSDIQDLFRLVDRHDLDVLAEELADADNDLAEFIARELVHHFGEGSRDLRYNYTRLRGFARNVDAEAITEEALTILGALGETVEAVLRERS